ncbi:MAG: hypothetical protein LJE65_14890 [Desulfobacteraceae bacterium]|nr:hypothetical protein [Desulfobacteraceae bacterium]
MRGLATAAAMLVMCSWSVSFAQSPPFSKVTIKGKTGSIYNKVCLFEKGSAKVPFKTKYVSEYYRTYSIDVGIPSDMKKKDDYFYTDMRFWGDKNANGMRDAGEPISQCHFIIWVPSANIVFMQVYEGQKFPIATPVLNYDYK